jgi:hypothetical protein
MFSNEVQQEGWVATALEEGRPHAAAAFLQGFDHLNRLRRIAPRAAEELRRLNAIWSSARPAQTAETLGQLSKVLERPTVCDELRGAAQRSELLGSFAERQRVEALVREIEALEALPAMRDVINLRSQIASILRYQTNVEVARWLTMALSPGDTVITSSGDRLW